MSYKPDIKRLDVETPLGVVHLAAFPKKSHREVIFGILSEVSGRPITAEDLVQPDSPSRPGFPSLDMDVNWTHSGELCVVAYTDSRSIRVGVDLERHSPKRLPVADRFYNPQEIERLKDLSASGSQDAAVSEFFRLWCRKEALFKCVGGNFFSDALGSNLIESPVDSSGHQVHFVDLPSDAVLSLGPLFQDEKKDADSSASLCVAVARWPQ